MTYLEGIFSSASRFLGAPFFVFIRHLNFLAESHKFATFLALFSCPIPRDYSIAAESADKWRRKRILAKRRCSLSLSLSLSRFSRVVWMRYMALVTSEWAGH